MVACATVKRWGCLAVVLATASIFWGCKKDDPAEAFLKFIDALVDRDAASAWEGLARPDRERLSEDARRLAELSKGTVKRTPQELLVATSLWAKRGKRAVTVVKVEGDRATLRVALEPSGEDEVGLVKEEGRWRVLLSPSAVAPKGAAPAPAGAGPG